MISISLIERRLGQQDYDRLLRDLSANGLTLPLSLRMQLSDDPTAVRGLALRRLVEITYGPTPLSRELVAQLLDTLESPDASASRPKNVAVEAPTYGHPPSPRNSVLTLAAALSALASVVSHQPAAVDDQLRGVLERGFADLAAQQDCDGLFTGPQDRSLGDRALTTAFVISLLGIHDGWVGRLRFDELFAWFDQHDGRLHRHTQNLWDLASIGIQGLLPENMGQGQVDRLPATLAA